MNTPITQSKEWQKLQDDLGENSYFEKGNDFQYLAILKSTPVGNYFYLPYGPVVENQTGFKNALKSLEKLAKENDAFFIRIEPLNPELIKSFPKNAKKTTDLNPKETWIIDLKGTEEDVRKRLPSRLLRYYKNLEKNNLKIETSHNPDNIKYLLNLQKALAAKKGINTFSEEYLKTELKQPFATLYLLKQNKQVIAAGLVFDDKTTRYDLQGAQSEEGRKLHGTGLLSIQLILDAKEKGLKRFDFWGIAPENASKNHPWAGFTNFKKTFEGTEEIHAGTYDLILKPTKYKLYELTRKLNRLRRRI